NFSDGRFQPILIQPNNNKKENVSRIILCSGKIGVDLESAMKESGKDYHWLQIVRVEELYPFPSKQVYKLKEKFSNAVEWVWVQEEPMNMGAWHYVY
ncbi:hypothetical protein, partial [Pseudomonas sp. 2822-17]|uniref:hypothetical protein n=1 Tax=Pseudomonas sp. 2822-17 TaxID=1712678 RepID=UPI001C48188B